jgi:ethanolamine utilization microcompartment shell protein EutL
MGHHTEPGQAKVKLAHYLDDGNKIEFEAYVEATDYQAAVASAEALFKDALKTLAGGAEPSMRKVKIEM